MTKLVTDQDLALETWPTSGELVVVDLEWTAWEGSLARGWSEPWEFREVIAIGAVRVDCSAFSVLAESEIFVRTVKNPALSDYITALTGITTAFLTQHGCSFVDGLARLADFAAGTTIVANGGDGAVLRENCILSSCTYPFPTGRVRTIRPLLAQVTGLPAADLVSAELPSVLGFGAIPNQHGALADAHAIVESLAWLRARGRI